MKKGQNPQRGEAHNLITVARIFVIVYVPYLSGFFSNMETILKLSLDSLERTLNPKLARVTLISNASCLEVEELLKKRKSKLFDQIIINGENRGKIDGLLAAARGALEEVVVLSDCDVLFQPGWLEEVLQVFEKFPETGSVSPIASPRRYFYETRTTILDAALRREVTIKARMPEEDFYKMTDGVDNPYIQLKFLQGQVTVTRNGFETGVGGSHQCVAYRKEVLRKLPTKPCLALLEPHADRDYLDRPPDMYGYWRLSTPRNFAFHMGNTPSGWMFEAQANRKIDPPNLPLPALRKNLICRIPYFLRRKLAYFVYLFLSKKFKKQFSVKEVKVLESSKL